MNQKIICIDIDGVICNTPANYYKKSKPIKSAIKKINQLYLKGYYIKLFTSRFMGRNNENVDLAKKQGLLLTKNQLKKWKLKYHKLIMGKPSYDMIIDDKSLFFKKNWYKYI